MPETLTESFCERCGTRYTFEAAAPRGRRLGKIKVLSKGLVNFVTNDDSSLDEAFADARSDQQRELTSHQLEAFHKTFQFCMSCRQYTCGNCWNEAEGRCLSCAPHLGQEILEAPFPDLAAAAILAPSPSGQNGHGEPIALDVPAWPTIDLPSEGDAAAALPPAELASSGAPTSAADAETAAAAEADAVVEAEATAEAESLAEAAAVAEAVAAEAAAAEVAEAAAAEAAAAEAAAAEADAAEAAIAAAAAAAEADAALAAQAEVPAQPDEIDDDVAQAVADAERARRAAEAATIAAAAAKTTDLLGRFRPGRKDVPAEVGPTTQVPAEDATADLPAAATVRPVESPAPMISLSAAALAADEAVEELRRAGFETEPTAPPPVDETPAAEQVAPEPVAVEPETTPVVEPVAAEPAVAAEPVPPIAPEPAYPAPEPTAPPSPRRDDRVEAPVWQIVAPETVEPPPAVPTQLPQTAEPPRPSAAVTPSNGTSQGAPGPAPEWPTPSTTPPPQWPMPASQPSPQWPARAAAAPVADLWAASSQDVLNRPGSGVSACVSCGLPLSAAARFCRRCGSAQH